jgi:hypothetical protein
MSIVLQDLTVLFISLSESLSPTTGDLRSMSQLYWKLGAGLPLPFSEYVRSYLPQ